MPSTAPTIRGVVTRSVIAPLAQPVRTASGAVTQAPLLLIDLITEEGVTGRAYLFAYQTFALNALDDLVRGLGATLTGARVAPFDLERGLRARFTLLGGARNLGGMAVAGLDMAAWDVVARAAGVPLVRLLGGTPRPLAAYDSLGMIPASEAPEAVAKTAAQGFRAMKIKIGWPSLDEDLAVVRAARRSLPDHVALMVDFNQSLGVNEAIRRGRALDDEGVAWIEEPVRADDFAGCARVAAAIRTGIQIGENFSGHLEMQAALAVGACRFVMPDVQQIGGVTGWLRAAALAQAAGVDCSSHIFVEASAHLLAVTPTCHWLEYLDVAAPVLAEPCVVTDGMVCAPDRPGLGLEWDEAAVRRFAV